MNNRIETGGYTMPGTVTGNGNILLAVSRFETRVTGGDPREFLQSAIAHETMAEFGLRRGSALMAHPELLGKLIRRGSEYWEMFEGGQ